jgi:hypothetical protein
MDKYIIKIPVATDADPSHILEVAQQFGDYFEEMTSEEIEVDVEEACVSEAK